MPSPLAAAAELVLLRAAIGGRGLTLRPGAVVVAKVLERGLVELGGARVPATLPDDVRPGQVLRLRVADAGPERVLLQVVADPPPAATAAVPLPGGATARLIEDDEPGEAGGGRRERAILLRYDSPTLGRLDIRLAASGAVVRASEGAPADAARAAAGELAGAIGAPVAVVARRSALDEHA